MDTSFGQHGVALYFRFFKAGQLLATITSFALLCLIIPIACFYPRMYFPLFITSWILELTDSFDTSSSLWPPSFCLRCEMEQPPRWPVSLTRHHFFIIYLPTLVLEYHHCHKITLVCGEEFLSWPQLCWQLLLSFLIHPHNSEFLCCFILFLTAFPPPFPHLFLFPPAF